MMGEPARNGCYSPVILMDRDFSRSGSYNMALDQFLFDSIRRLKRPVWRLYIWNPPAVSIGRNQRIRQSVDLDVVRRDGLSVVRRPTGGRAIWHSGDICFTHVGITPGKSGSISAFGDDYMRAAGMVARFLGVLGINAEISSGRPGEKMRCGPLKDPCFRSAGRYEIVAGGRKVAGIAQYRSGERFLIQGSIRLTEMDSQCGRLFFGDDDRGISGFARLRASVTSVEEELRRKVGWEELGAAFLSGLGPVTDSTRGFEFPDFGIDCGRVGDIERARYGNSLWNGRI